jgi:nucleoside-triphosphatase THEP1
MAMTATKRLAGISFPSKFPIDALLQDVVDALARRGLKLGGVVQVVATEPGRHVDVVRLRDLRDGSETRILQDLGPGARGCRLDAGAIAGVAARLERTLEEGADLLVVNRFGRGEAEGHGLRSILERAVAAEMAVLVAVRTDYGEAWGRFHGGLAEDLPAEREAILAWADAVFGPDRMAVA